MYAGNSKWRSRRGFIFASIGSTVGFGNIWGFPYNMGSGGGLVFLAIYALLAFLIGGAAIASEHALGRMSGCGVPGAYAYLGTPGKIAAVLAVSAAFIMLSYYCVLGGMSLRYALGYLVLLFGDDGFGVLPASFLQVLLSKWWAMLLFTAIFCAVTAVIVSRGWLERFALAAIPLMTAALVLAIGLVAVRDGAIDGFVFMFKPDFEPILSNPGGVILAAGRQMFFSLSIGLGIAVAFGSMLDKSSDIRHGAAAVVAADTGTAILSGMLVLPACAVAGAAYGNSSAVAFITMHTLFADILDGFAGYLAGFLFFSFMSLAAITSTVAMLLVCTGAAEQRLHSPDTTHRLPWKITAASFLLAIPVALDGLGGEGVIRSPYELVDAIAGSQVFSSVPMWASSWMSLLGFLAEGLLIPLAVLLAALALARRTRMDELSSELGLRHPVLFSACIRFGIPLLTIAVALSQILSYI
jgi:NSS family neurotransmitter:Na+ symporter